MLKKKRFLSVREIVLFAMLGTLMFLSKLVMEALPNVHLLGTLTVVYTIVFRAKALVPIYVYVFLTGIYAGFSPWWVPHIYLWTILWAVSMLLPRKMPKKVAFFIYPAVSCLHGLLYGVLYAPVQALMFGLGFEGMIAWIAAGAVFDIIHGIGNLVLGLLIVPLSELLLKLERKSERF